jgi:FkbM family methyltransferase
MRLRGLTALIYRTLVMVRHPEAIRLRRRGIDYDQFRHLRQRWLLDIGIRTILDVGANTGQFARLAAAVFPSSRIFSFEPLPDCFEALKVAVPPPSRFQAFNIALGEREASLEMRRSRHSPSSSFLEMGSLHKEAFPDTGSCQRVTVAMRRLDEVARQLPIEEEVLLKLDVQGYEDKVIAGASETLPRVRVIIVETSFHPLYEGQLLFHGMHELLRSHGFGFQGTLEQLADPRDGRILQADSVFVRR